MTVQIDATLASPTVESGTTEPRKKAQEFYRRGRNATVACVALLGAGVGYEAGWGWGAATAAGLLAAFFALSAIVEGAVAMIGITAEAVAIARKEAVTKAAARRFAFGVVIEAIDGLEGHVIKKQDLIAALREEC